MIELQQNKKKLDFLKIGYNNRKKRDDSISPFNLCGILAAMEYVTVSD